MNIRKHFDFAGPYHTINREERNFAAIFYHVLLSKNNLDRFLSFINCTNAIDPANFGIYFEYAFIRDIWDQSNADNSSKRQYILDSLTLHNRAALELFSIEDFNKYFGVANPSRTYIQSPSKWSMVYYDKTIVDNEEFLRATRFKWCFNAKPDIVIHLSGDSAICIEAKLESREGVYPGTNTDKAVFKKRGLGYIGQRDIQSQIMETMLGVDVIKKYLVKEKTADIETITWREIFACMDVSDCNDFIRSWIARLN